MLIFGRFPFCRSFGDILDRYSCKIFKDYNKIPWRRKWQPTPVFLSGKSHAQRTLVAYSPKGCKESSDMTERLSTHTYTDTNTHPLPHMFTFFCFYFPPFFLLMWTFKFLSLQFSSVTQSCLTDFLWPHELQHARPPCPSPTPGVHANSSPSSQWCHPAVSSSVVPFSSCPYIGRAACT